MKVDPLAVQVTKRARKSSVGRPIGCHSKVASSDLKIFVANGICNGPINDQPDHVTAFDRQMRPAVDLTNRVICIFRRQSRSDKLLDWCVTSDREPMP